MEIEVQSPQPYTRTIIIRVPADEAQNRYNRVLSEIAKDASWPGFRKGKVPKEIVRQHYEDAIIDEIAEQYAKEGFSKALEQDEFTPMMRPRIEKELQFISGSDFVIEIKVEVRPPIEIRQYEGLSLSRKKEPVTEDEIDNVIENLRLRSGYFKPIEDRAARAGDHALIDFQPKGEEEPSKRFFELDTSSTVCIVGHKPGDTFDGHFEFPDDFPNPDLAGNIYDATVTLLELKEMVLPELDENFFAQFGEEVTSLEVLRDKLREDLDKMHARDADRNLRANARQELVSRNPLEISPLVIEVAVANTIQNYWDVEKLSEDAIEQISNDLKPRITQDIIADLLLGHIADKKEIEIDDETVKNHVMAIAQADGIQPESLYRHWKKIGRLETIRAEIKAERALDIIIEKAKITEI